MPPKENLAVISSYSVQQKANEESWKLRYDIYKHLTTLSTGSILLVVTFLEKVFVHPIGKGLVIVAFCSLFASILASFIIMNILASAVRRVTDETTEDQDEHAARIVAFALISFLVGILCLMTFAVINLYRGNLRTGLG